jgi:hypothetical protein
VSELIERLNIANIARGALVEQADEEIQKVLDNIKDPNTDPKKVRKVSITITFKPNEKRNLANVNFQTKATLIPALPVETNIVIEKDSRNGKAVAAEIFSEMAGQLAFDAGTGEVLSDTRKKVVNMKK